MNKDQILSEIEMQWCERMTYLVDKNLIDYADALYSEYVIDEKEPDDWFFFSVQKNEN